MNVNIKTRNKDIKKFSKFLEKNKDYLSEYELGIAYSELESCSNKIDEAYKFYKLSEKYLINYDFELFKLNMNNFYDFCNSLIQIGDKNAEKYFKEINDTLLEFYKCYGNFSKDEVQLMLQINLQQRINDELILQLYGMKNNYN